MRSRWVTILLLFLALLTPIRAAHQPAVAAPPLSPLIAVAINGDIYVLRADGTGKRRLTRYGFNGAPQLGPRQRLIAYLSVPSAFTAKPSISAHNIWLAPVDGGPASRITQTDATADRSGLAWAPDGLHLAWFHGHDLQIYDLGAGSSITALLGVRQPRSTTAIAWSPDSRRLAVERQSASTNPSRSVLHIAIVGADGRAARTIVVRFPADMMGSNPGGGSIAGTDGISWTADGAGLLLSTHNAGEGLGLTGIWRVSTLGGTPHLVVGTFNSVLNSPSATIAEAPLYGSTHFVISPNRALLATDPTLAGSMGSGRLYIGDVRGTSGMYLPLAGKPCVIAQSAWLLDSSGIAYVNTCGSGAAIESSLNVVAIAGNRIPHRLLRIANQDQRQLDLAPTYRCVACGA